MRKKHALLNRGQLVAELGLSRSTLYRMEAAGAPFPAGRSRVEWLLEWLKANPKFSSPRRVEPEPPAPASELADDVLGNLFHLAFKAEGRNDDPDKLTPGEWNGQPALFAFNSTHTFAIVFNTKGRPLGLWLDGVTELFPK